MSYDKSKPYNELPVLPPKPDVWENLEVYKILTEARAAMAELKGRASIIPNPKMLINTLVLQEAKDSSSIENVYTTNDKLYRAFSAGSPDSDPQTKEVLRYRQALWEAWQEMQEDLWNVELMEKIYRTIKEKKDGLRKDAVYIGGGGTVVYTPPLGLDVLQSKLQNWFEFANAADGTDPLIKMAILHYQFEAIHPFLDGNGRTGRVLNVLFLSRQGLLDLPILYLSKYINDHKGDYYKLLREVTESGAWTPWITFMLKAVSETASFTLGKVNAIDELHRQTMEKVKTEAPKIYSYELVEILFHQPYCRIAFLVDAGIASRNTASKYLNELADMGILTRQERGNEVSYENHGLIRILGGHTQ